MTKLFILTWRTIKTNLRNPFIILPNLFISTFFLLVYNSGLSGIGTLPQFQGHGFLGFIIPLSILMASIGGAGGAGQGVVRDFETRYFNKLALTPVSNVAIIMAHIIAGAIQMVVQVIAILAVGLALGLDSATGFTGLFFILLISVAWGLAFAGYSVGMALITKNAQAAQSATFLFFPLMFLTNAFVPMELITSGWLKTVAKGNPTTYALGMMREIMLHGYDATPIWHGVIAIAIFAAITISFAVFAARKAVQKI